MSGSMSWYPDPDQRQKSGHEISKELLGLTGYIHGGCSPIGMKKFFKTTFQKEAAEYDTIRFSAEKMGYQVELPLKEVSKVIRYQLGDIVTEAQ